VHSHGLSVKLRCRSDTEHAVHLPLVADLEEAVAQVGHGGFDVAVLDINLRDQPVYVIADQLEQAAIPFVFATGYSAEVIPHRFQHVIRLEKPCDIAELVKTVSQLCSAVQA